MKEARGDLLKSKADAYVVTTNGFVKRNGECVMGRGIAKQIAMMVPEVPGILGRKIQKEGNIVNVLLNRGKAALVSFPVKPSRIVVNSDRSNIVSHCNVRAGATAPGFYAKADIGIITKSLEELVRLADKNPEWKVINCPRFGCGAGELSWGDVKPIAEQILDDRFVIWTF